MNRRVRAYRGLIALCSSMFILGMAYPVIHTYVVSARQAATESPYLRNDPEKIVLSDRDDRVPCGECHALEYDVWKTSSHATGFDTMHRSAQAQSILERMDFRLAKRESVCLQCHYTAQVKRDQVRAISGVSCESCHGAARDWLEVHNNYAGATHDTETPQNKGQRIQASIDGGMLRPSDNIYAVAANCFECHTVPSERLINVGRHPSGSRFELVDWSDRIRHNYLAAQWSSDESNRENAIERKRLMYVVGRLLDYEYSVRGVAEATETGSYAKAMERRVKTAVRELEKIARVATIPEIATVLRRHQGARLVPNNKSALLQLADQARTQGQQMAASRDGSGLAAVDVLLRGGGGAADAANVASDTGTSTVGAGAQTSTEDGAAPGGDAPSPVNPAVDPSAAPAVVAAPTVAVAGQKRLKPAWFPEERFEVVAPGCNCHATAEDWLFEDAHGVSADPIVNESRRAVQIAQLYGLTAAQMKKGNQICMQCHGTVESGLGGGQVFESVGCESCHGPSSGYLQPHKRGQGAQHGLRQLREANVRAANCAQCHHITDERLLASGHSSGSGYDIVAGNTSIKHWPDPDLDRPAPPELAGSALQSAFESVKSARPVPQVQVASPPPVQAAASRARTSRRASSGGGATSGGTTSSSVAPRPPRPRPVGAIPSAASPQNVTLPPLPAVADSSTTEDLLRIVKERLELLYQAVGRNE